MVRRNEKNNYNNNRMETISIKIIYFYDRYQIKLDIFNATR